LYWDGVGQPTASARKKSSHGTLHLCYIPRVVVHTLGHSTLALEDFLGLLEAHAIGAVADVRRFPASRRHPHFAREPLAAALAARRIVYQWLPALGGRRDARPDSPHVAWRNAAFRGYADHMDGAEFREGLRVLLSLAEGRRVAIMCAEAVPWRCHRQLIADALVARDVEVRHVTGRSDAGAHRLTPFARLESDRIVYDRDVPGTLAFRSGSDRP
jgi:uncharacterized protein (DUF488 family)